MEAILEQLKRQNDIAERREKRDAQASKVLAVVGICALAITGLVFYDRFS